VAFVFSCVLSRQNHWWPDLFENGFPPTALSFLIPGSTFDILRFNRYRQNL